MYQRGAIPLPKGKVVLGLGTYGSAVICGSNTPSLAAVFTTSLAAVKTTQKQSPAAVKPTSWEPLGWGGDKVEMVTHVKRG